MNDNKQQVDLTCLLRMTWPKDVIDKWNNSDLQDAILSIWKENPKFYLSPISILLNILQSNKHTHSHWKTTIQTLQMKIKQFCLFLSSYELLNMQNYLKIPKFM